MSFNIKRFAEAMRQSRRSKNRLRGVVGALACVTVTCTLYALMLPAFTMTTNASAASAVPGASFDSVVLSAPAEQNTLSLAAALSDANDAACDSSGNDAAYAGESVATPSENPGQNVGSESVDSSAASGSASPAPSSVASGNSNQASSAGAAVSAPNEESAVAGDAAENVANQQSEDKSDEGTDEKLVVDGEWTHPQGSITGTPQKGALVFYNFDGSSSDSGNKLNYLAGVTYTIYRDAGDGNAGEVYRTCTSENDYAVLAGMFEPGSYIIAQTAVPEGYVVYPQTKQFTVAEDGTASIGVFYDYKADDFHMDKTAQVVNYADRRYQVDLTASSGIYSYQLEPENYAFVVDQSNSMLFPAQLNDTGKAVTLYQKGNGGTGEGVKANSDRLNAVLGKDTKTVYYIVADEANSSTIYALWYDPIGEGWCYQDASYYAKAQFYDQLGDNAANCTENGFHVAFAQVGDKYGNSSNPVDHDGRKVFGGGDVDKGLGGTFGSDFKDDEGNAITSKSYRLYTGNKYNRLHELQDSVGAFAYLLGSMNEKNTMQLVTFTKEPGPCAKIQLDSQGVSEAIKMVNEITTSGGTRQDYAIQHLTSCDKGSHLSSDLPNKIILITDGAPAGDKLPISAVESNIKASESQWDSDGLHTTLISIGLSMENVLGGSKMLEEISSPREGGGTWFFDVEEAGALSRILLDEILSNSDAVKREYRTAAGNVEDVISHSFYPTDENGKALASGTWIKLDGTVADAESSDAAGQLNWDDEAKTWRVSWNNQMFGTESDQTPDVWKGRVYLKAKEDFVGGNAIDTNCSAQVQLRDVNGGRSLGVAYELPTPTVNVRLLDMNEHQSEITLFKGDIVNPAGKDGIPASAIDAVKTFYGQTEFTKLVSGTGDIYNKVGKCESDGCAADTFTLAYAAGQLTDMQWAKLENGETVEAPYVYDDSSSHGAVGYFEFSLTKEGESGTTPEFVAHELARAGDDVEAYTLHVAYKAYGLGESAGDNSFRPQANVHNGEKGPGTMVGTEGKTTLPEGCGTVAKTDAFTVNGVEGQIVVTKNLDDTMKSDKDQTFTFELKRDGDFGVVTQTVTVKANEASASVAFDGLARGTYTLTEKSDPAYAMKNIEVVASDTTCQNIGTSDANPRLVQFVIGTTSSGSDIISYKPTTYTFTGSDPAVSATLSSGNGASASARVPVNSKTVYSTLAEGVASGGENNFVFSKGHAQVTNTRSYYELPNTGGGGTTSYTAGGLIAVVGAGAVLAYRFVKRKRGGHGAI